MLAKLGAVANSKKNRVHGERKIFDGPFDHFQNKDNAAFGNDQWLEHCKKTLSDWQQVREPSRLSFGWLKKTIKTKLMAKDYCPAHLRPMADLLNEKEFEGNQCFVLDVGGGFGDNFYGLETALGDSSRIKYFVVDDPKQAAFGREVMGDRPIVFQSQIELSIRYQVATLVSTLQYVEDWKSLLYTISQVTEKHLYICRTPLQNSNPDFCLMQSIAFQPEFEEIGKENLWVLNEKGLLDYLSTLGWRLSSKSEISDYSANLWNLPKEFQEVYYANLLFEKV